MNEKLRKVTVRLYEEDMQYLQAHPVEDALGKRIVPFNEFLREVLHIAVDDLKAMRGH